MFEGKIILVTGSGRGIGRSIALEFARTGGIVYIASRTEEELDATAELIEEAGCICEKMVCDLEDKQCVSDVFEDMKSRYGRLDVLVNNAGMLAKGMMEDMDMDEFHKTMAVNVTAPYTLCRLALPLMKENGGAIVNIASLAGIRSVEKFPGIGAYTVSKHALVGLTEALAAEWKEYGIRVNCIAPGAVETEMLRRAAPDLHPVLDPGEVAASALFLASDAASGVNGSTLEMFSHLKAERPKEG